VKYTLGKVAATEIVDVFRSAEVIGTRGWMSLAATTTDCWGLLLAALALSATRTKATMTRTARRMPRRVKGRREVIALNVRKADQS